jgi:N utilization substance protein B
MLSRRSVRVKVMQVLYAQNRDKELHDNEVVKLYNDSINGTFDLFLLNLYLLIEISRVSVEEEGKRISKYIPTEDDRLFKSTLYNNDIIKSLVNNKLLKSKFDSLRFAEKIDGDIIRKLYRNFSTEQSYIDYWHNRKELSDDRDILLELYRFLRASEVFNEKVEELYYQWISEKSVVIGSVKKVIKREQFEDGFINDYLPQRETTHEFGEELLKHVLKIEPELEEHVVPRLLKWDKDRIAVVDMVFIKMSLAEVLYFETIPCNVTLNEYVELSKDYSTDKSKEFINGVMDKVIRDLKEKGLVKKKVKK